jgi:hypothetical protein
LRRVANYAVRTATSVSRLLHGIGLMP